MQQEVLVPREDRRVTPPRRDADRLMALDREAALWKRLDTMWREMRTAMTNLQTQAMEIDSRSKTIQQSQQRRAGSEWTLVLAVVLAFATAVLTVFVSGR